jgi:hypothetical protein
MPLQNRVTPFSTIIADPARGLFTGNRGILHNDQQQLVTTRWRTKAWIVCLLHYKNMRRPLMEPRRWTQLFFLDEVTAFAAGHRPCAYCRRQAYNQFLKLSGCRSAKQLDQTLHAQRLTPQPLMPFSDLPNHAMYALNEQAFLKHNGNAYLWTPSGYQPTNLPATDIQPLTPPLTQQVLSSGYQPITSID